MVLQLNRITASRRKFTVILECYKQTITLQNRIHHLFILMETNSRVNPVNKNVNQTFTVKMYYVKC